MKRVYNIAILR